MATTANASQMPHNFHPGPAWTPMSQGTPYQARSGPTNYTKLDPALSPSRQYYDGSQSLGTFSPPEVRVTSPSTVGGSHDSHEEDWDDEKSIYSARNSTSTNQDYYSQVFQSDSHSSNNLSMYSSTSGLSSDGPRDSWQTSGTARPDSNVDPFAFRKYETPRTQLPKVVVSSPTEASFQRSSAYDRETEGINRDQAIDIIPKAVTPPPTIQAQGRVPSAVQGTRNFSRPNRPPVLPSADSEERKREVLERNMYRHGASTGSPQPKGNARAGPSANGSPSPQRPQPTPSRQSDEDVYGGMLGSLEDDDDHLGSEYVAVPLPPQLKLFNSPNSQAPTPSPSQLSPLGMPPPLSHSSSVSSTWSGPSPRTPQGLVPLPTNPLHMRSTTPESLYSNYSYYPMDNTPPASATLNSFPKQDVQSPASVMLQSGTSTAHRTRSPSSPGQKSMKSPPSGNVLPTDLRTAEDFLTLGITHHEADRLEESAQCFEQSATLNGGCAVGMLMWGLALRHGWGVPKDEIRAFKWLKRAAEHAVVDLQEGGKYAREAVKNELVLAVYEVGQCFFRGWGVPRDKVMGVSYFQTAAQLGDPDAQQDLAFCLANGKGCKKDRKAAAKWYRAAAAQGASTVGLAWIYKPKYAD